MKRFIRYMYEYRDGKRVQNMGFVKVEEFGDSAVIQIYGKGFPAVAGQELEILLFYLKGEQCVGIPMERIHCMRPMINYRLEYSMKDLESWKVFEAIEGLVLRIENGGFTRWYAAIWNDVPVNIEGMLLQEEIVQRERVIQETVENQMMQEREQEHELSEIPQEPPEEQQETIERQPVYKITRQDMVNLPRQEWKLANNHFLVHGCRNYHHLVSFEKDGKCWLGVPGIYHRQEEEAAKAFGFGEFMKPEEGEILLMDEEKSEHGEFGYWCRQVHNVIKR